MATVDHTIQHSLFGDSRPLHIPQTTPDEMTRRRKAMKAAFDHADEKFKDEYRKVLMQFVESGQAFIGEDVRRFYASKANLPQPREWRCVGALYQKLVRQGVLEVVGYRKRNQGNMTAVYRRRQ